MQGATRAGGGSGNDPHSKRRACLFCEAVIWAKPLKRDFRAAGEWRRHIRSNQKFRAHWLIRFRPRQKLQGEMWRLNIPAAVAAVRGEFGRGVLGSRFKRCLALVSLMLKGCGSLDLVLISRSGDVAIGECKLQDRRDPEIQLKRYCDGFVVAAKGRRLWAEIERSYGRYEFTHLCGTVRRHFGLHNVSRWCARVERNAADPRRITRFSVRGVEQVKALVSVNGRREKVVVL